VLQTSENKEREINWAMENVQNAELHDFVVFTKFLN
jgi:hypothetical protein